MRGWRCGNGGRKHPSVLRGLSSPGFRSAPFFVLKLVCKYTNHLCHIALFKRSLPRSHLHGTSHLCSNSSKAARLRPSTSSGTAPPLSQPIRLGLPEAGQKLNLAQLGRTSLHLPHAPRLQSQLGWAATQRAMSPHLHPLRLPAGRKRKKTAGSAQTRELPVSSAPTYRAQALGSPQSEGPSSHPIPLL